MQLAQPAPTSQVVLEIGFQFTHLEPNYGIERPFNLEERIKGAMSNGLLSAVPTASYLIKFP